MTHLRWSMMSVSPCTGTVFVLGYSHHRQAELLGPPVTHSRLHNARRLKTFISLPHVVLLSWEFKVPTCHLPPSSSSGVFDVWSVLISCLSSNPYMKRCQYLGSSSFLSRGNGCGSEHAAAGRRPFGRINFDLKATSCIYLQHNRCERNLKLCHKPAHVPQLRVQVFQHGWMWQHKIEKVTGWD